MPECRYTICKVSPPPRHRMWPTLGPNRSLCLTDWKPVDAQPLSELDLARLRTRVQHSVLQRVAEEWRRPSDGWRQTLRWTAVAVLDELRRWQAALPGLLRGDFVFTLALWVAVFSVAAAVVAQPTIPLPVRYSAGLAAVAYLYLYAELARIERPLRGRRVLLGLADGAIVAALGALSMPYVGYAHGLVFFAAARMAARFRDPRILPAGGLLLVPFEIAEHATIVNMLLDAFAVVMTMLLVVHLTTAVAGARQAIQRQGLMSVLISSLARVRDEDALFAQLAAQAPALAPTCAWAFWIREPSTDEFRAVRWAGLPAGELPGFSFTPTLGPDRSAPLLINGPLPGTSAGECTLLQPAAAEGELNGLITVAGHRLAGLAARHAANQVAALEAIRPALADTLRSESLHLEWVDGDRLRLVVGENDPLQGHAPAWLSLAGTRTAEVLLQGKALREPLTGRRPEDLFGVPAGLRQLAVAPLQSAGMEGTLQLGRRLPRAYSAGELLLVQLLAERLGLLFAAGRGANVAN